MSATTYRVHGNNTQGNAYVDVILTIVEPTASLSPSSQSHVLTKDAIIAGAILQNLTGGVGHVGHPPSFADWDALQHRERDHHRDPERQSDFDDLHHLRQQLRR